MDIIGRKEEISELERLYNDGRSEFVVLYGRRRVGKTFLVNELFRDRMVFSHTALSPVEIEGKELMKMQLQNFCHSMIKAGADMKATPDNWLDAFFQLEQFLESRADGRRQLIFIDELPWLDTPRSGFVTAFEAFWNGWCAKRDDVMLVVCGSAVSWISDELINGKGGLYDRVTAEIKLKPFSLRECEEFFRSRKIVYDRYDIIQSYMVFGGIPYYLNLFVPGKSLAQNIDSLIFNRKGKLANEYERLFSSIFKNPEDAEKTIKLLSGKRIGYTRDEIIKKTGIGNGGAFSKMLLSLLESDFVTKSRYFGEPAKNTRYRLSDNFCLFYKYFADRKETDDPGFWQHNQSSPSINSWRGFAFENVCFQHINNIKKALGIAGVHTETYSWSGSDSQIDMLIDRADRLINLCECKFCSSGFTVDKEYDRKLRERQSAFAEETKTRKPTIMTLVTTFGLKQNEYSGRFQSIITADDLFSA